MTVEALIYIEKKGVPANVPVSSLTYQTAWDIQPTYYKFVERYIDADGDVVKESAHAYSLLGVTGHGVAGTFGQQATLGAEA